MTDESSGNRLSSWYDVFSRGARDWLRHNEKVRDAVRAHLPQVVAGADVLSRGQSTVRVPVRMLEHYRFKLRNSNEQQRCASPHLRRFSERARGFRCSSMSARSS